MPGTDAWQFLGKALGANPVPMAFTEVYTGLQTGAIDGQDNPLPTDKDSKFYEVAKQICLTSHLVDLNYLAFSKAVWDKLTPDQQATVQKAADDAAESGARNSLRLRTNSPPSSRTKGLTCTRRRGRVPPARAGGLLASDYAKDWPPGLIDKINAL